MSEHQSAEQSPEVFELQESPSTKAGSTFGGLMRFALYGFAALLLGGLVAVQASPELGEYVAGLPGMSQLAGDSGHTCPMSQASACQSSCPSSCPSEMATQGCCSEAATETLAVRPPAPPMAEPLELSTTEL